MGGARQGDHERDHTRDHSPGLRSGLDAQIAKMNEGLSHPEQIRKYRVIERPLSIRAGELTPNLKVKRANVEAHFASEIEEMYQ